MFDDNFDDFEDDLVDSDGYSDEYGEPYAEDDAEEYADEYSAGDEDPQEWAAYPPDDTPPTSRAYYSLGSPGQPQYSYPADSRDDQPGRPDSYFSGSPGPGCIAVVTIVVCLSMALFLLRLAAGIPIPELAPVAEAITVDPAVAGQPPAPAEDDAPVLSSEAANTACQVSGLFPEKVLRWCGLISFYAGLNGLNPDLIAALVWLESGGDELAYSRSGAVGLMQVMPSDGLAASFQCINGPCFADRPSTEKLQDPEFNLAYGMRMFAGLLRRHGDMREALRSYGPMNVGYFYADKVLGIFEKYKTPTPTP
jgi:hypothetical protein